MMILLIIFHDFADILRNQLAIILYNNHYVFGIVRITCKVFIVLAILHDNGFAQKVNSRSSQELSSLLQSPIIIIIW